MNGLIALTSAVCLGSLIALSVNVAQTTPPVSYYIYNGESTSGYVPADRDLARLALDAWARESGGRLKFVEAVNESEALLQVRWISAGQGGFGEMQRIDVNGKAGAVVFISAATSGLGEPLATLASRDALLRDTIVYLTCVHEIGHAVGLQHTNNFADIMYSFAYGGDLVEYFNRYRRKLKLRADIRLFSGLSEADVATLKTLY